MARSRNLNDLPQHPSIDWTGIKSMRLYGHVGPSVRVKCPICRKRRWIAVRILRNQATHPNYSGICKPCWLSQPKARTFRSSRNPSGRRITTKGYVVLGKNAISDADLPMFDAMRGKSGFVFEHRWIMAKHLGRPLTSAELVDHDHGRKGDNRIERLRLYVRGKQQPGSAPGHGTYYHEWQMAERRIREIEAATH
jgi:hypothetical protein